MLLHTCVLGHPTHLHCGVCGAGAAPLRCLRHRRHRIAASLRPALLLAPVEAEERLVFRWESPSLAATLKACRDDAALWRSRFSHDACGHIDVWLPVLRMYKCESIVEVLFPPPLLLLTLQSC